MFLVKAKGFKLWNFKYRLRGAVSIGCREAKQDMHSNQEWLGSFQTGPVSRLIRRPHQNSLNF